MRTGASSAKNIKNGTERLFVMHVEPSQDKKRDKITDAPRDNDTPDRQKLNLYNKGTHNYGGKSRLPCQRPQVNPEKISPDAEIDQR